MRAASQPDLLRLQLSSIAAMLLLSVQHAFMVVSMASDHDAVISIAPACMQKQGSRALQQDTAHGDHSS